MEYKACWLLSCGTIPPGQMAKLERRLAQRMAEQEAQEPNVVFSTDFYYHDIFPRWPGGGALSGSMSHPGVCAMHPGDEAILFCLVSRKGHRDTLEELEADLKRKGCPYSIALL